MSKQAVVTTDSRWVTPPQGPQLVRWGSVFSGTIIAIAVFALLDALWLALSFGSHESFVYSNLSWWVGGTAIFCLLLAGLIAGISSSARGVAAGTMGGLTTWALVLLGVGAIVLPIFGIGHVPNTVRAGGHTYSINYLTYWTTFWSLLIGLGAAVLGGILGGVTNRRVDEPYLDLKRSVSEPAVMGEAVGTSGQPVVSNGPVVVSSEGEATRQVAYERSAR